MEELDLLGLLDNDGDGTTTATSAAGSDETDLGTWTGIARDGTWLTHVLVSTTTVWVIDWVHSDTTDDWPGLALSGVLVVNVTGLEEWLLKTATTGDNTEHGAASRENEGLAAGWELDTGVAIIGVGDDTDGVAGAAAIATTITWTVFDVANFHTFWDLAEWEDGASSKWSFWAAGDDLASVDAFWGDNASLFEGSLTFLLEDKASEWGATTWIVNEFLDNAVDDGGALGGIEWLVLGGALTVVSVSTEDITVTLTLSTNDVTHVVKGLAKRS